MKTKVRELTHFVSSLKKSLGIALLHRGIPNTVLVNMVNRLKHTFKMNANRRQRTGSRTPWMKARVRASYSRERLLISGLIGLSVVLCASVYLSMSGLMKTIAITSPDELQWPQKDEMPHKNTSSTTQEDLTHKRCIDIVIETRLQAPKSKTQKWSKNNWGSATASHKKDWTDLGCVKVLGLYDTEVLSYNDTLPPGVYKPSLAPPEQRELYEMTKAFVDHMQNVDVLFFPAFGSLLGLVRNNIALLPWDDDVDFEMHDDGNLKQKISKGLKKPSGRLYTSAKATDVWELPGGWIIYHKKWGMPWKVHPPDKGYPNIDMNTFKIIKVKGGEKRFVTPVKELTNGHLHKFDKPASWFGAMNNTITVPFSSDVPDLITFRLPDDIAAVVTDDYGEEGLTHCITSQNHNPFCNRGATGNDTISCENAMANHLAKTVFPCTLLPAKFHGPTLVNEPHYKRGEKSSFA